MLNLVSMNFISSLNLRGALTFYFTWLGATAVVHLITPHLTDVSRAGKKIIRIHICFFKALMNALHFKDK